MPLSGIHHGITHLRTASRLRVVLWTLLGLHFETGQCVQPYTLPREDDASI